MTRTIRAALATTSVGANMDLIASHRPFLRMAPVPPCEPALAAPFYPYGERQIQPDVTGKDVLEMP
jgi:hypothetical protein